jgi:hypothetical protein
LLRLSLFYSIDIIELLFLYGFDTLEYSWMKATVGICTLVDYSVAKKCQQIFNSFNSTGDILYGALAIGAVPGCNRPFRWHPR